MTGMANIAYVSGYREQCGKRAVVFAPENLQEKKTLLLRDGYTAARRRYAAVVEQCHLHTSETVVFDPSGMEVYRYRNLDDDCEFIEMIRHGNGHLYLLFRVDLHGYGVFDLTDKKEFLYVPEEGFIWTGVHHNPENDVLAVSGCFWACPNGLHLLDFKNPLQETKWVDAQEALDGGYDRYDSVEFIRWAQGALIVEAYEIMEENGKWTSAPKELVIDEKEYRAWLRA
ncbi:MAG: hypothetical protein LBU11_02880 [Zoogloeaceae bacterium]|jgi:hypothetical protein|nr:hypothetical protein [Zoogloeaceae bacterium]